MTQRRWLVGTLFVILTWFLLHGLTPRQSGSSVWTSFKPDLSQYQYVHDGKSLINTTFLFADWSNDPILGNLLLSAFGRSFYDNKVIPFYRRKSGRFSNDQVTMITWLTGDRLGRLVKLADRRSAPISIAFFIPSDNQLATQHLLSLDNLISSYPNLQHNVDIHLVTSSSKIQLNVWRDVARTFSGTDWVLQWDGDFEVCTDYQHGFEQFLKKAKPEWVEKVLSGKGALVIPAFEWSEPAPLRKKSLCPANKKQLSMLYEDIIIDAFETFSPVLSHATDYPRFMEAGDGEYYKVENFEMGYENYAIFRRDIKAWFDGRFIDPGYERCATIAHQYLSGMDFYVLTDQWTVHEEHPSEGTVEEGDAFGSTISWKTFRVDLCHGLATGLADKGLLHLAQGDRVVHHCESQDIQEISRDINRLLARSKRISNAGS